MINLLTYGSDDSMKKRFLTFAMNIVRRQYIHYTNEKLAEIQYGLESFYITITKMIVIFSLALWIGIFPQMLILLLCFNVFRTTAFGLHASKGWICLISSSLVFLIIPWGLDQFILPLFVKIVLGLGALTLFGIYAPADTKKRPILRKEKRRKYRIITMINCILLTVFACIFPNQVVANAIFCGMYIEIVLILPITYRLFHLPYANYKTYVRSINVN